MSTIWCNGDWIEAARFAVGVGDRCWTHGLGVFETMLGARGRVAFGERHHARLAEACRRLGWTPPWPEPAEMLATASSVIARAGLAETSCRVRLAVSGGSGSLADLSEGADRLVWMTAGPMVENLEPLAVCVSPWRRNEMGALSGLKCASYAENLVALDRARREGFRETLFFNTAGNLCEAATANVFVVTGELVRTPSLATGCLAGVARGVVLELARRAGFQTVEAELWEADLAVADEVFLTSALRGPIEVARVDHRWIPAHRITRQLRSLWLKEVFGADPA